MRLNRLSLRMRLVAGFVGAMVLVLLGAGAFVFWRVQVSLDHRIDQDLAQQTGDLRQAATRATPSAAIASLRGEARDAQLLGHDARLLASGPGALSRVALLTPAQARRASRVPLRTGRGYLFSNRGHHLRILALPAMDAAGSGVAVAVTAVRLDQRDEALRELLAQLTVANLLALALASAVGYRLARAALDPVERYRARAEQIAQGATGVRLEVPEGAEDEISRLGATLNSMLDAQQRASERQRQFIDDASHELRTPLTTLATEVDLALRKPRTAEQYESTLRRIAVETEAVTDLADVLLTLGALGSATPSARGVGTGDLLESAARRARGQLDPGREVRVRAPEGFTVHGDPALLERALGNLVDNACRYGDGAITLAAEALDGVSRATTLLTVHDEGSGISCDFLPHAADRFSQDESSRSRQGAGLGLSIVDAILTAHHGQLRICSAGRHHHQGTPDAALRQAACRHPASGTTISLLFAAPRARESTEDTVRS